MGSPRMSRTTRTRTRDHSDTHSSRRRPLECPAGAPESVTSTQPHAMSHGEGVAPLDLLVVGCVGRHDGSFTVVCEQSIDRLAPLTHCASHMHVNGGTHCTSMHRTLSVPPEPVCASTIGWCDGFCRVVGVLTCTMRLRLQSHRSVSCRCAAVSHTHVRE
jgi:hypothetical protein